MEIVSNSESKKRFRSLFAHIDRGETYLNHAAISPLPTSTASAIKNYLCDREGGPIENYESWMEIIKHTRSLTGQLINAPDPGQISFMGNTSDAISAVAEGFAWKTGDEIILNTAEFPANVQPFRILERKGVRLIFAKPDENGYITPQILGKLISPRTKMLSVSAVQYLSGFRADLDAIGELCRNHDIFFVVDGIQGLGAVTIDVQRSKIDALAAGAHKWLMSPMGTGFLYLSDHLSSRLKPSKTGWLSVENAWELSNYEQDWLPLSKHLETGTYNVTGIIGLNESLKMLLDIGISTIEYNIHALSEYIIDKVSAVPEADLLTPVQKKHRSGIVSFMVSNHCEPEQIIKKLKKEKITISAREGYYRMSPHFYNTKEEIDTVTDYIFHS